MEIQIQGCKTIDPLPLKKLKEIKNYLVIYEEDYCFASVKDEVLKMVHRVV